MKYIWILTFSLLLMSCGSAHVANKVEKEFKGEWTLESVSFPDSSGFFDVDLFDVADVNCFENSMWKFIPNNSSGDFTLDGSTCSKTQNQFTWYVDPETAENTYPEVLMKITTGHKAKNVNTGSRIRILSLVEDEMIWEQITMFEGKEITIEMQFSKF